MQKARYLCPVFYIEVKTWGSITDLKTIFRPCHFLSGCFVLLEPESRLFKKFGQKKPGLHFVFYCWSSKFLKLMFGAQVPCFKENSHIWHVLLNSLQIRRSGVRFFSVPSVHSWFVERPHGSSQGRSILNSRRDLQVRRREGQGGPSKEVPGIDTKRIKY